MPAPRDPLCPPFLGGGVWGFALLRGAFWALAAAFSVVPAAMAFDGPVTGEGNAGSRTVGPASASLPEPVPLVASISLLGDPRFEIREAATRALEQAGIAAIAPLQEAAAGENLEITTRAIRSLSSILDTNDDATFDAAEGALERLEASANRSAGRRAAAALASHPLRRWNRAVVRFNRLGGGVKWKNRAESGVPDQSPDFGNSVPTHVILGEGWSGGSAGLVNIKRMTYSLQAFAESGQLPPGRLPLPLYVIDGAKVSPEALEELLQALPGLDIQSRGRARLGVFCVTKEGPCTISDIERNSAAERAGLRKNDVVVRYDGETVDSFDQLTLITSRHKVADRIKLEVEREGAIVELEAELSGWVEVEPKPKEKK